MLVRVVECLDTGSAMTMDLPHRGLPVHNRKHVGGIRSPIPEQGEGRLLPWTPSRVERGSVVWKVAYGTHV